MEYLSPADSVQDTFHIGYMLMPFLVAACLYKAQYVKYAYAQTEYVYYRDQT